MGLVDGGSLGGVQVIVPSTASLQNLISNPSFELDTTGWTATSSTLTRTAGAGVFGRYGGRLLASATNGKAGFTGPSVASGTLVVASAWVKSASALVQIKLTIGASSATQFHTGDGLWHRIEVPVTAPSTTTPVVEIIDTRTSAWTNVDIDGVQLETGVSVATTYMDGDQPGCAWDYGAHQSTSTRDSRDGRGGSLTTFDSLGLLVEGIDGIGAPPVDVQVQQHALADGATYQGAPYRERILTLSTYLAGAGLTAVHAARLAVLNAINPDNRNSRGPIWLRYAWSAVPKRIGAVYEGGFDFHGQGPMANERIPLRFLAPDPFWEAETETQVTLDAQDSTTMRYIAMRKADGSLDAMAGGLNTASSPNVYALATHPDGKILVGGTFTNTQDASGAANFAYYNPLTGAWGRYGGINPNGVVYAIAVAPNGNVAIGGDFTLVGAVANTVRVALWNGSSWTALSTGANATVRALAFDRRGFLFLGGDQTTPFNDAAYWNGSAWVTAAGGVPGNVNDMVVGPDGFLYAVTATGVWIWQEGAAQWSQLAAGTGGAKLAWDKNTLYVVGDFTTFAGVSANGIIRYRGSGWEPLGSGIDMTGALTPQDVAVGPDGTVYVVGNITSAGGAPVEWVAAWNGSVWSREDMNFGTLAGQQGLAVLVQPNGSLIAGFNSSGTVIGPGFASVTNPGTAPAYPVIKLTHTVAYNLHSLINYTTGQQIRFALSVPINVGGGVETITIDLRPGQKKVYSENRDLLGYVIGGSDLSTFALAPGVNRIGLFADLAVTAQMSFKPRYLSAD